MKIRTEDQTYGWVAVDDDRYDGPGSNIGAGRTEREALEDLFEQLECDFSYDLESVRAARASLNQEVTRT